MMMHRLSIKSTYQGSSLIELLIASGLSCGVVLAAITTLQTANTSFIWQEQAAILRDSGNYAVSLIEQALKQIAYVDYTQDINQRYQIPDNGMVWGADARTVKSGDFSTAVLDQHAVNGSDVLVIRFPGSATQADGSVVNCAGFAVSRANTAEADRGWSIFYVAKNSYGEPELRCKYRGNTEWDSQAIVSGVESFQVLYGIDTDGDGLANQYLNASAINKLDAEKNMTASHWTQVASVRISLLLHAPNKLSRNDAADKFDLFGSDYADANSHEDTGTRILRNNLPPQSRSWYRHIVQSIIYLRNPNQPALL